VTRFKPFEPLTRVAAFGMGIAPFQTFQSFNGCPSTSRRYAQGSAKRLNDWNDLNRPAQPSRAFRAHDEVHVAIEDLKQRNELIDRFFVVGLIQ